MFNIEYFEKYYTTFRNGKNVLELSLLTLILAWMKFLILLYILVIVCVDFIFFFFF